MIIILNLLITRLNYYQTVTQPSPNNNDGTLKHEQLPYHENIYVIFDDHLKCH